MFSELGRKKSPLAGSMSWSGQPGWRANRRAVAKANARVKPRECFIRTKLICGKDVVCQGVATDLMARADAEELRNARIGTTGGTDGGNSGKFSDERPEGERNRQDSP